MQHPAFLAALIALPVALWFTAFGDSDTKRTIRLLASLLLFGIVGWRLM